MKKMCLLWTNATNNRGYGVRSIKTAGGWKTMLVHRVAYMAAHPNETLKSSDLVCHHCDVRNCYEPTHLFKGTAKQNTRDMINKGRIRTASGPEAGKAKLTMAQVKKVRAIYAKGERGTLKKLCEEYGLSKNAMVAVVKGRSYKEK